MAAPPTTTARKLMANTVLNMINQALTAVINFGLVGFFLDTLGEARYGVWILIGSIFSYRTLTFMGLNSAVNRHIPVHLANEDHDGIRRVISTAFVYYLIPTVLLTIGTVIFYLKIGDWFAIDPTLLDDAKAAAAILGFSFALGLPFQVYSAVLSSYQRFDIMNSIAIVGMILRTAVVVALLRNDFGLLEMSIAYGATEIGIRMVSMLCAVRIMSRPALSLRYLDSGLLPKMITYGVSTIFYMSSSLLVFKTADLVIGSLISSAAVSRFYIATTPALLLATFIQVFAQAMKPAVSDLDARDEHGRIEEMAILSQKYTLMAIIPGVTFLVLMGESFLRVWVGDRFPDPSSIAELAIVLQVLAIGSGLRLSQHTNFIVLVGKGNHRIFGMTALGMWLTSAALSIASVRYFGAGLTGIAWACAIPMAVVSITILPRHFIHAMEISLVRTIRGSWAPALYSTAPALIMLYAWSRLAPPDSWLTILAAVFGAGGLTVICGWFVGVTPSERAMLRRALPF